MKKLFKSKKLYNLTDTIPSAPNAQTIFTKTPFIQYEQILLDKNFREHLETTMVSKKILCMGVQKTPIQKTCKIALDFHLININFLALIDNLIG